MQLPVFKTLFIGGFSAAVLLVVVMGLHSCGGGEQQPPPPETSTKRSLVDIARDEEASRKREQPAQQQPAGGQPAAPTITSPTGLQYQDLVVGQGPAPQMGQTVTVHYTGWLTNGSKFDSSKDKGQPFQFVVGAREVIRGWDEGVASMRVGGKRRLIVPPDLGYGDRGAGGVIPPGATLVFDVELLGVQ